MRKTTLFTGITILLAYSIVSTGCSYLNKKSLNVPSVNQVNSSNHETFKLTFDKIRKNYTDTKIKSMQNIGTEYVLVESQGDTFANKFDIYNFKTGDMDTLPTMPEFVTLEKVENENYFVFLSSGKNS